MSNYSFDIYIDSCGELEKALRDKYEIDYCPMMVSIGEKEIKASLDYDQGYSFHEFYDVMRNGTRVRTTQVPPTTFVEKFTESLKAGKDVLYIACSSALSASVKSAQLVAKDLLPQYPGRRIECFDALNACYGEGMMAIKASEMRKEGKTIDEIVAFLKDNIFRFNQFATVDDLKYLKQAGRVKASAAFFGNIFGVHPIIISDVNGANNAVYKVKGKKKALVTLAQEIVNAAENIEDQTIYIGHSDDLASAEFVKKTILSMAKPKDVYIGPIGPTVGASTGPGTIGVYCFGKTIACDYARKDA